MGREWDDASTDGPAASFAGVHAPCDMLGSVWAVTMALLPFGIVLPCVSIYGWQRLVRLVSASVGWLVQAKLVAVPSADVAELAPRSANVAEALPKCWCCDQDLPRAEDQTDASWQGATDIQVIAPDQTGPNWHFAAAVLAVHDHMVQAMGETGYTLRATCRKAHKPKASCNQTLSTLLARPHRPAFHKSTELMLGLQSENLPEGLSIHHERITLCGNATPPHRYSTTCSNRVEAGGAYPTALHANCLCHYLPWRINVCHAQYAIMFDAGFELGFGNFAYAPSCRGVNRITLHFKSPSGFETTTIEVDKYLTLPASDWAHFTYEDLAMLNGLGQYSSEVDYCSSGFSEFLEALCL